MGKKVGSPNSNRVEDYFTESELIHFIVRKQILCKSDAVSNWVIHEMEMYYIRGYQITYERFY